MHTSIDAGGRTFLAVCTACPSWRGSIRLNRGAALEDAHLHELGVHGRSREARIRLNRWRERHADDPELPA